MPDRYIDEFKIGEVYENVNSNQHFQVMEIIPVGPRLVVNGRRTDITVVRKRSVRFRHVASGKDTVVPYEDAKYYPLMRIASV